MNGSCSPTSSPGSKCATPRSTSSSPTPVASPKSGPTASSPQRSPTRPTEPERLRRLDAVAGAGDLSGTRANGILDPYRLQQHVDGVDGRDRDARGLHHQAELHLPAVHGQQDGRHEEAVQADVFHQEEGEVERRPAGHGRRLHLHVEDVRRPEERDREPQRLRLDHEGEEDRREDGALHVQQDVRAVQDALRCDLSEARPRGSELQRGLEQQPQQARNERLDGERSVQGRQLHEGPVP